MKLTSTFQSEAFRRWVSVCVVAVMAGLFCCQVLNMESYSGCRHGEDQPHAAQADDDEDSLGDQPFATEAIEHRAS